jgi:hypothetical protein
MIHHRLDLDQMMIFHLLFMCLNSSDLTLRPQCCDRTPPCDSWIYSLKAVCGNVYCSVSMHWGACAVWEPPVPVRNANGWSAPEISLCCLVREPINDCDGWMQPTVSKEVKGLLNLQTLKLKEVSPLGEGTSRSSPKKARTASSRRIS